MSVTVTERRMNAEYARWFGPDAQAFDGCPACRFELEDIGPLHGPEKPPRPGIEAWGMTPREWAGDGPLKLWGR